MRIFSRQIRQHCQAAQAPSFNLTPRFLIRSTIAVIGGAAWLAWVIAFPCFSFGFTDSARKKLTGGYEGIPGLQYFLIIVVKQEESIKRQQLVHVKLSR